MAWGGAELGMTSSGLAWGLARGGDQYPMLFTEQLMAETRIDLPLCSWCLLSCLVHSWYTINT